MTTGGRRKRCSRAKSGTTSFDGSAIMMGMYVRGGIIIPLFETFSFCPNDSSLFYLSRNPKFRKTISENVTVQSGLNSVSFPISLMSHLSGRRRADIHRMSCAASGASAIAQLGAPEAGLRYVFIRPAHQVRRAD